MTRAQITSVIVFVSVIMACMGGLIAYDVYLSTTAPDDANTISWSMSLLGSYYPIFACAWGFFVGAFGVGLAVHFFLEVDSPMDWDELVRLKWQIAALKAAGVSIPDPPDSLTDHR
jgi:hypothetical protein